MRAVLALLVVLALVLCLPSCAAADRSPSTQAAPAEPAPSQARGAVQAPVVAAEWQPLRAALAKDGLSGPRVDALLAQLAPRTPDPMGRKMVELYRKNFIPSPKPPRPGKDDVYRNVVTKANAQLCLDYIARHKAAFARAERAYGVPPSVAASLLFVETRLGRVLRDVPENALHTLASMSQSTTMASIEGWLGKMPGHERHQDWFARTMPKRADWAYRETRALVRYMLDNNITADRLPGSIYGAIGLCQFMPSNIGAYGVDGSGDGVIDLYTADDAVMSLSNYLHKHGWKASSPRGDRHRVLMRYNKSVRYANTILALADLVEQTHKPARKGAGR